MAQCAERRRHLRGGCKFHALWYAVIDAKGVGFEALPPRDRQCRGTVEPAAEQHHGTSRRHDESPELEALLLYLWEVPLRGDQMSVAETPSADQLETFPNPSPGRDYSMEIVWPEFTSL